MPLPPGFELESSPAPAVKLPPGFELETEPRVAKKPTREELIAAIPGEVAALSEIPAPRRSVWDVIKGTAEVPLAVGQGLIALPAGAASALYKKATGQPSNIDQEIARFSYQPTTETGRERLQQLGAAFEASKLPPMPGITGGLATVGATRLAGPALRQAAATPVAQAIKQEGELLAQAAKYPLEQRAAAKQAQRVAKSYERAPKIESAQEARKYGINLNPEESNPSVKNKILNAIAGGNDASNVLSRSNLQTWNKMALADMDLPPTAKLDAAAFEKAHANPTIAKPYDAVRGIPTLAPSEKVLADIQGLQTQALIGGERSAAEVQRLIDSTINQIDQGLNGSLALDNIQNLRRNANAVYTAQSKGVVPPSPEALSVADAQIGIANALENLIEANIRDPKLLSDFRKARAKHAQIYDWERATDIATGQVDPKVLADMVRQNKPLSEAQAAAGRVAANYPDIARVSDVKAPIPRVSRTGFGGALGFGLGLATGVPGAATVGGIIGGVTSEAARLGALSRMRNPAFQAANAIPIDYRLPVVNQLAQQRPPTAGVPVPFDPRNAIVDEAPYQPNWVYGQRTVDPNIRPEVQPAINRLAAPTGTETMDFVARQRAQELEAARAADVAAAARAEAAAQAARRPAAGEVLLDYDPVTGRLRSASRGLPGATPEVIESTGKSLESAVEKLAANRAFDLTATEKIAWEKTRTSLSIADPGFAKLTEKQILERSMDRQWVADTLTKARQKAQAFAELAARAKDERARQSALVNREKMMELAETLDEMMQQGRPVAKSGQGPKTRAARNALSGGQTQNKLIIE